MALISTSCTSLADAVDRDLRCCAAPRAVPGAPDDGPTGLTATRVSPALIHAGSIAWVSLIGVLEGLPRGAAQALVGPRCGARGALGAARLADVVIGIVAPELVALIDALAGGGEVVIRDARCANLAGCLRVITCLAVGGATGLLSACVSVQYVVRNALLAGSFTIT